MIDKIAILHAEMTSIYYEKAAQSMEDSVDESIRFYGQITSHTQTLKDEYMNSLISFKTNIEKYAPQKVRNITEFQQNQPSMGQSIQIYSKKNIAPQANQGIDQQNLNGMASSIILSTSIVISK